MMKQNKKQIITIIIVLIIMISIIPIIYNQSYKSKIQRKLIGLWNIELENSYATFDTNLYFVGSGMNIEKNKIKLPSVDTNRTITIDLKGKLVFELDSQTMDSLPKLDFFKLEEDARGTWSIISTNPDSVFFDVPLNPLHGKYALRFFIDRNGYRVARNNIYKIELSNDSTSIICNKAGIIYPSDVHNWEDDSRW